MINNYINIKSGQLILSAFYVRFLVPHTIVKLLTSTENSIKIKTVKIVNIVNIVEFELVRKDLMI